MSNFRKFQKCQEMSNFAFYKDGCIPMSCAVRVGRQISIKIRYVNIAFYCEVRFRH